tara:strand:- start:27143 stop:27412 length:270 start_codon:yes stop_codon:yes gene_type:complete
MDLPQLENNVETKNVSSFNSVSNSYITLETEIPEVLYNGLKEFIGANPKLDQYEVMSSALANFLYQNGCEDRAVTEKYLNDLFTISGPQ